MPQGTLKAPQNRAELDALVARRTVVQNQLRDMEDRRSELASRAGTNQQELDRRIKALDSRINVVEEQLQEADKLISDAVGKPVAMPEQTRTNVDAPVSGPVGGLLVPPPNPLDLNLIVGRALVVEAAAFLLLGAIGWVFAVRRLERRFRKMLGGDQTARLQQSVDAIAIEVERISENQRYVTKLLNDKALDADEAHPISADRLREPVTTRRDA